MGWIIYLWLPLAFLVPHGDLHEKIADLSKAITLYPDSTQLYQRRGELYLLTEENKAARADFHTCIRSGWINSNVYLGLSKVLFNLHLPDSSLFYTALAITSDTTYAALEWKGFSLLQLERYCESTQAYVELLTSAQHPSPALFIDASFASRHCPEGSPSAEEILKDGIARTARLPVLEQELVRVYLFDKRYEDAVRAQTEIIQHRTVKAGPYYDRAEIYLLMNEKDTAIEDLRLALISIDNLPVHKASTPAMKELKKKITSLLKQLEG